MFHLEFKISGYLKYSKNVTTCTAYILHKILWMIFKLYAIIRAKIIVFLVKISLRWSGRKNEKSNLAQK